MARRKRTDESPSGERWLVSYADFITLLFAFFVVMYSISTVNDGKYRVMSDALTAAFHHDRLARPRDSVPPVARVATPLPRPLPKAADPTTRQREQREQRLLGLAQDISDALRPLVQSGQVRLTRNARGLAVEINASVLFAPGQAALQPDSTAALSAVAAVLATVDNAVHIEGHTDNLPIAGAQYPSNWELASARASSVVRLFVAAGVEPARLVVLAHADNRPVETNETVDGRARNRRVTLMILADRVDAADSTAVAPGGAAHP